MLEQMKRAAVLLAIWGGGAMLAFPSGAWGQSSFDHRLEQSSDPGSATKIASEYFGAPDGREVQARASDADAAKIVIQLLAGGDDPVSAGNEADLTFSLAGATFASRVSLSQFESTDADVSLSLATGGQKGDSSVTVHVGLAGDGMNDAAKIIFTLPDLHVTPVVIDDSGTEGATVDASIEITTSAGRITFPDEIIEVETPTELERVDAAPEPIYELADALEITLGAGSDGQVSLMDRKVLTGANDMMPTGSLNLGALTAASAGNSAQILGEGGDVVALDGLGDAGLQGMLIVTASGDFQTDDKVMLGEAELTRSEDGGSYSGGVAIADAGSGLDITYVPGGVDDLLPTTFNTTVTVRYDDELNASGPVEGQQATATINYEGISLAAYAHGIVKAGGAAVTYLRVACPGATDCSVFAACKDQSGASHFGELGVVAAGGLEVYDSNEIGEALDGGWETGRGRCDLLSDGVLEVQNMLNQGSANVNNSLVTNGAGVLDKTQ